MSLIVVFLVGLSGLILEITWIRALEVWLGAGSPAVATALASALAGAAAGRRWLAPRAARSAQPARALAGLCLGAALTGGAISLLLLEGGAVMAGAGEALAGAPGGAAARPLAFLALLLPPAALAGAALPALAERLLRGGVPLAELRGLYGAGSGGAALGALAALALTPLLGMTGAALIGAGGLGLAGLLALSLPLPAEVGGDEEDAPEGEEAVQLTEPGAGPPAAALGLVAAGAACGGGLAVTWDRVLGQWSGGWEGGLAVLLAVCVAAAALGGALAPPAAARRQRGEVRRPLTLAAALLAGAGAAALVPLAMAPTWLGWLAAADGATRAAAGALFLAGPTCLLLGAALPSLAAATPADAAARALARLEAAGALAAAAGAGAAGFLLLPLGAQRALWGLGALACAAALLVKKPGNPAATAWAALCALGAAAALVLLPPTHLAAATFRDLPGPALAVEEGRGGVAAAVQVQAWGRPLHRALYRAGGLVDDTGLGARREAAAVAHLPVFLRGGVTDALLLGYGAGNVARSLLSHPDLKRLQIVEPSEATLALSAQLSEGSDPLDDPRVAVSRAEVRQHLLGDEGRYDVIAIRAAPEGEVGAWSRGLYAAAAERLTPGGVVSQRLPLDAMSARELAGLIDDFTGRFPHAALFYGHGARWVLVGSLEPLSLRLDDWRARAALPGVAADLAAAGAPGWALLAGFSRGADLADAASEIREDPTAAIPKGLAGSPFGLRALLAGEDPLHPELLDAVEGLRAAVDASEVLQTAAPLAGMSPPAWRELIFGSSLRPALFAAPGHPEALALLGLTPEAMAAAEAAGVAPEAELLLARRAYYADRWAEALSRLEGLSLSGELEAQRLLLVGGCRRALGEPAGEALAAAAAATEHAQLREVLTLMARHADAPWPKEKGPLAGPE